eukprot:scaffold45669_cov62-Phaeocystis_antarctica.AAC.3
MVCAGCPTSVCDWGTTPAPGARVSCLQRPRSRSVRASSCPNSGGSSFSGQPPRRSLVRARSCPIWGGSTSSEHQLRSSLVRARSCPISGGSSFSGHSERLPLWDPRSSSWTRSPLLVTPLHERGLSPSWAPLPNMSAGTLPSGHHFCSAGLAARIACSVSSSVVGIPHACVCACWGVAP